MECNLCKKKVTNFLDFNKRRSAKCPNCSSLERHRFAAWFLTSNNLKFSHFLHIAPESVLVPLLKSVSTKYTGGDLLDYERLKCRQLDATNIDFEANTFDGIFASHILEHIPEDTKAMQEFYRVLRPKGVLMVMIPQKLNEKQTYEDFTITSEEERTIHFGQKDHVRWYGTDFTEKLKSIGFYVTILYRKEMEPSVNNMAFDLKSCVSEEVFKKYSLATNDILYICQKP